jgi:hypothetical protein
VDATCAWGRCGPHGAIHDRFAIGLGAGHLHVADHGDGRQRSLLARVRVLRALEVELELSRADLDDGAEGRSAGAGLVHPLCPHRHVSPYVAVGAGGGVIETTSGLDAHQRYAELGGGLLLRGRRFALGLDARAGVRGVERDEPTAATARLVAPAAVSTPAADDGSERSHYLRARVLALVYF